MAVSGEELRQLADSNSLELQSRYPEFVAQTRDRLIGLRNDSDRHVSNALDRAMVRGLDRGPDIATAASIARVAAANLAAARDSAIHFAKSLAAGAAIPRVTNATGVAASFLANDLARDLGLAVALTSDLNLARHRRTGRDRDLERIRDRARDLARELATTRGRATDPAIASEFAHVAAGIGEWANLAWIVYVLLGAPYKVGQSDSNDRTVTLRDESVPVIEIAALEIVSFSDELEAFDAAAQNAETLMAELVRVAHRPETPWPLSVRAQEHQKAGRLLFVEERPFPPESRYVYGWVTSAMALLDEAARSTSAVSGEVPLSEDEKSLVEAVASTPADTGGLERGLDQVAKSSWFGEIWTAMRAGSVKGAESGSEELFSRVIGHPARTLSSALALGATVTAITTHHAWISAGVRALVHLVRAIQ